MSYTVLTKEAEGEFSGLHHRIPVILSTDEEVQVLSDYNSRYQYLCILYSVKIIRLGSGTRFPVF